MITKDNESICQLTNLGQLHEKNTPFEFTRQVILRSIWNNTRRLKYVINYMLHLRKKTLLATAKITNLDIQPGDYVKVKSKDEIKALINARNELKGCTFMDEMWVYSGTTQRVFKRVERFMDERDYRVKRANGLVLLENVYCEGTGILGRCDRSCFFFWREEWLEKIEPILGI
jgi:hypothetical protein